MMTFQKKDLLTRQTGRAQMDMVVDIIKKHPGLLEELWAIYLSDTEPHSRKAAWALDTGGEQNPEWILPYIGRLILQLPSFSHEALVRHGLRMISRVEVGDEYKAGLIDFSFSRLLDPKAAVAVKVHAINILFRFTREFPELKHELAESIEYQMQEGTAGFKNISSRILAQLLK